MFLITSCPGLPGTAEAPMIATLRGSKKGVRLCFINYLPMRYMSMPDVPRAYRGCSARITKSVICYSPTADAVRSATRASTATGAPSGRILMGLMSISRTSSCREPISPTATMIRASASRSTGA